MAVADPAHGLREDVDLERLLAAVRLRHAGNTNVGTLLDVCERGLDQRHHRCIGRKLELELRAVTGLDDIMSPSTRSIVPRTRTVSCADAGWRGENDTEHKQSQQTLQLCLRHGFLPKV